jgi:hypothetical protein
MAIEVVKANNSINLTLNIGVSGKITKNMVLANLNSLMVVTIKAISKEVLKPVLVPNILTMVTNTKVIIYPTNSMVKVNTFGKMAQSIKVNLSMV